MLFSNPFEFARYPALRRGHFDHLYLHTSGKVGAKLMLKLLLQSVGWGQGLRREVAEPWLLGLAGKQTRVSSSSLDLGHAEVAFLRKCEGGE